MATGGVDGVPIVLIAARPRSETSAAIFQLPNTNTLTPTTKDTRPRIIISFFLVQLFTHFSFVSLFVVEIRHSFPEPLPYSWQTREFPTYQTLADGLPYDRQSGDLHPRHQILSVQCLDWVLFQPRSSIPKAYLRQSCLHPREQFSNPFTWERKNWKVLVSLIH